MQTLIPACPALAFLSDGDDPSAFMPKAGVPPPLSPSSSSPLSPSFFMQAISTSLHLCKIVAQALGYKEAPSFSFFFALFFVYSKNIFQDFLVPPKRSLVVPMCVKCKDLYINVYRRCDWVYIPEAKLFFLLQSCEKCLFFYSSLHRGVTEIFYLQLDGNKRL